MPTAILFKKCLGYNDAKALGTQIMKTDPRDPEAGDVELIDCLNLTITPDGCLQKIPPMVTALTHSAPVTNISAGKRFMLQDAIDVWEWTSAPALINRFPILGGPIVHTPIDCRVSNSNGTVYKSLDSAPAMQIAVRGDMSAIPATSKPLYAMPAFRTAFVYGPFLYAVSAEDPRFIQYSHPQGYLYDVWRTGDDFIGHAMPVLQAGAIPGVILATHDSGVTAYVGSSPADFSKWFYPCDLIDKTLYSGFISKVYGYSHVFLCNDGVYAVGPDDSIVNLTVNQTDYVDALNSEYYCATVMNGKYLAIGDRCCLEYDFKTKTVLIRGTFNIVSACVWSGVNYFASGSIVTKYGDDIDDSDSFTASMTLPFSTLNASGAKSVTDLYFTGQIDGEVTITATDNTGKSWSVDVTGIGKVYRYRIKTPRGILGNHISFKIDCRSGVFRLEELRAVLDSSSRSK